MSKALAHKVANQFGESPVATTQTEAQVSSILSLIADTSAEDIAGYKANVNKRLSASFFIDYDDEEFDEERSFLTVDGVAVIPIYGSLINHFDECWGFVTGYNFIRSQVSAAAADPNVKHIALDVDCPGGHAVGCADTAAIIASAAKVKPVTAVVDGMSTSGSCWLTSGASRIVSTGDSTLGSIGVIAMHVDQSKLLERIGITVTTLKAGEKKDLLNPNRPMTEAEQKDYTSKLETMRVDFATTVADNRGIDVKSLLDTEAACLTAKEALSLGLIDEILSSADAYDSIFASLVDDDHDTKEDKRSMASKDNGASANKDDKVQETVSAEQLAAARAEGVASERERISAIMSCEQANGRTALANHFAFSTDMTPEQAVAALGFAPVEVISAKQEEAKPTEKPSNEAKGDNPFERAMAKNGGSGVGMGDPKDSEVSSLGSNKSADDDLDAFFNSYEAATGKKA